MYLKLNKGLLTLIYKRSAMISCHRRSKAIDNRRFVFIYMIQKAITTRTTEPRRLKCSTEIDE